MTEEVEKTAVKKPAKNSADESHLVSVTKDGETLRVHPSALTAHLGLGWKESK